MATGPGPKLVNPASKFGARGDEKLRAACDLKRSQTNRAAAVRAPVNPPTGSYFAAILRTFQEAGTPEHSALAKADRKDAKKQLPVYDEREILAAVAP